MTSMRGLVGCVGSWAAEGRGAKDCVTAVEVRRAGKKFRMAKRKIRRAETEIRRAEIGHAERDRKRSREAEKINK